MESLLDLRVMRQDIELLVSFHVVDSGDIPANSDYVLVAVSHVVSHPVRVVVTSWWAIGYGEV